MVTHYLKISKLLTKNADCLEFGEFCFLFPESWGLPSVSNLGTFANHLSSLLLWPPFVRWHDLCLCVTRVRGKRPTEHPAPGHLVALRVGLASPFSQPWRRCWTRGRAAWGPAWRSPLNPGQMLTRDSVSSSVEWCYAPAARCDCDRPVWAPHPQAAASPSPSPVLTVTQVCLLCPRLQSSFSLTPGSVLDVRFPLCSFVQRAPCLPASRARPPLVPLLCPRQSSDLVSGLVSPPLPRLTPRPLTHAAYSCITCPAKFWKTGWLVAPAETRQNLIF